MSEFEEASLHPTFVQNSPQLLLEYFHQTYQLSLYDKNIASYFNLAVFLLQAYVSERQDLKFFTTVTDMNFYPLLVS